MTFVRSADEIAEQIAVVDAALVELAGAPDVAAWLAGVAATLKWVAGRRGYGSPARIVGVIERYRDRDD